MDEFQEFSMLTYRSRFIKCSKNWEIKLLQATNYYSAKIDYRNPNIKMKCVASYEAKWHSNIIETW